MNGSLASASAARISSSALSSRSCVLVVYGVVFSTSVIRLWSKKIWPTWEAWTAEPVPRRVRFVRTTVSFGLCVRRCMCVVLPV